MAKRSKAAGTGQKKVNLTVGELIAAAFDAAGSKYVPTPTLVATPTPLTVSLAAAQTPTPMATLSTAEAVPCFQRTGIPAAVEDRSIVPAAPNGPFQPTSLPLSERLEELDTNIVALPVFENGPGLPAASTARTR